MRIGERITINLAGEEIDLHPSLGNAMRLERREGSFGKLFADLAEGSLTAAMDIIASHTTMPFLPSRILDAGIGTLQADLVRYLLACIGNDPDAAANDNSDAKPVPFAEHHRELFRIGTGWLGWTPADTLDATPLEIQEAYKGRAALLKAIFGGSEGDKPDHVAPFTDDNVKAMFGTFGTVKAG